MDGRLVPAEYAQLHPFIRNWFANVAAIQFDHRLLAMTTFAAIVLVAAAGWRARRCRNRPISPSGRCSPRSRRRSRYDGISTLLLVVPIPLAVAHQAGAVILLDRGDRLPPHVATWQKRNGRVISS